jgi:hypothetical protein
MNATPAHRHHHYEVGVVHSSGKEHVHEYATEEPLEPGSVVRLEGRFWLVERIEGARAQAKLARYRLRLRYPDGREDVGAFRRFRPDSPQLGHAFVTEPDGRPVSWEVVDEQLAVDERGEPYLDLVAERDFEEVEAALPDHELEHTLASRSEDELAEGAQATLARAADEGLSVELVALEPGEEPDWEAAQRFIDALVLEEIDDDLLVRCGVDTDNDPRDTWLDTVKERLRSDLEGFRADVEGDHDEIEEWSFRGGRVLASTGSVDDESDPNSGHGWMCRLVDSEALGAGGFERVRKAELAV